MGESVTISHEHRFMLIKTRKTAGTSVEIALSRSCGPDDIIRPIVGRMNAFVGRLATEDHRTSRYRSATTPAEMSRVSCFLGKRVRFFHHCAADFT